MATYVHRSNNSRSSNGRHQAADFLPSGPCSFRDIGGRQRVPTCGCRRFWLNLGHYNSIDGTAEKAYCFCGHHACFHDATSQALPSIQPSMSATTHDGYENSAGKARLQEQRLREPTQVDGTAGLGIRSGSSRQPQSTDNRMWEALNAFARRQEDGDASASTSRLPSTASPGIASDFRPGSVRATTEPASLGQSMRPPLMIPQTNPAVRSTEEYSATEVATPSIAGTPDFRVFLPPGQRTSPIGAAQAERLNPRQTLQISEPSATHKQEPSSPRGVSLAAPMLPLSIQEVQSLLQSYGRRIEALESMSFNQVPVEEIQERFELFDGRLLDVEQWREERNRSESREEPRAESFSQRRRLLPSETGSIGSDGSFDSAAAAHTEAVVLATLAASAEVGPRIDALESRIDTLEAAALPSFTRPWHVQVVLLPWGRALRGIWFSALDATQHSLRSTQNSEEWTGAQSAPKLSFRSSDSATWTTESIEAWANDAEDWRSGKACGPNGKVFQRLASRGLVQDVAFSAPDWRHIASVLAQALPPDQCNEALPTERFHGLRERFIPLRKVRKSSRLRFLGELEMITSAPWTSEFLDASVMMKTNGMRRLYVTTREAYIQGDSNEWSWPRLRQLPIYQATKHEASANATRTAIESCWTYNDKLDHPASTHSSLMSHHSQWSIRSQASPEPRPSDKQCPEPLSPHSEARRMHQRTLSLPSSASAADQLRTTMPKRRVASFETAVASQREDANHLVNTKRRRISISPEAERRGVGFTPRMSREPPSPYTSEQPNETRSQATSSRLAYATPHSNNMYAHALGMLTGMGGEGDTEAGSEVAGLQPTEDEWQGVDDDAESARSDDRQSEDDIDEAEDNEIDESFDEY